MKAVDYLTEVANKADKTEDEKRVVNFFEKSTDKVETILEKPFGTLNEEEKDKVYEALSPILEIMDNIEKNYVGILIFNMPIIRILSVILKLYINPLYKAVLSFYTGKVKDVLKTNIVIFVMFLLGVVLVYLNPNFYCDAPRA